MSRNLVQCIACSICDKLATLKKLGHDCFSGGLTVKSYAQSSEVG